MLTALMILWLPLQGFAAVAMPFCKHAFHAPGPASIETQASVDAGAHDSHQGTPAPAAAHQHHDGHVGMHHHGNSTTGPGCDDCGACNLACSPAVPSSPQIVEAIGAESFTQISPAFPPVFVPEQRKRPPLDAIA
jgi:hypothetical protein